MNADRLIRVATAGTVAALAGIAAAISYSHMRLLAQVHNQAGWHAHAFPLSTASRSLPRWSCWRTGGPAADRGGCPGPRSRSVPPGAWQRTSRPPDPAWSAA